MIVNLRKVILSKAEVRRPEYNVVLLYEISWLVLYTRDNRSTNAMIGSYGRKYH